MDGKRMHTGFVVRIKGSDYYVASGGGEVRCTLGGRFRIGGSPEEVLPVVGDEVEFRGAGGAGGERSLSLIVGILPRSSVFARKSPSGRRGYRILGANLDHVILVFAALEPPLNNRLLDRMLVAAECGGMDPVVCVNKMDLAGGESRVVEVTDGYRAMGYSVLLCSAKMGSGLDPLRDMMVGKKSIMVGPSGAGKTSIISALQPGLELRIGRVSKRTGKGRHTTTHFELHRLENGGYLGDTPGLREFGIWGVSRRSLAGFFRDFAAYLYECRFTTCTHSHEPGCSVKAAVEEGLIAEKRYGSYLRILDNLPPE